MMTSPPQPPSLPAYGRLIESAREARGISQRAAARLAGIGRQTWIDAARGYRLRDRQMEPVSPEARTIARMAHAVDVDPGRLADEGQRPDAAEILREILRTPPEPPAERGRRLEAVPGPLELPGDPSDQEVQDFILDQESPYLRRILMRTWQTESIPREIRVASVRAVAAAEAEAEAGNPGAQRERRREPGA